MKKREPFVILVELNSKDLREMPPKLRRRIMERRRRRDRFMEMMDGEQ